jgi:hypothetical protein
MVMTLRIATRAAAARMFLTGVLMFAALAAPTPADASCAIWGTETEMLADADVVFVGTVAAVRNESRSATVKVEEVWQGPDLPTTVEVDGGQEPGVWSSVDRQYTAGSRYLFAVAIHEGMLRDSACTMTSEWADDLLRFRPPAPRAAVQPLDSTDGESGADWLPLLSAAIVVTLGAAIFGGVLAVRSRRREPWINTPDRRS